MVTKTESLGILHHLLLLCHRKLQGFRVSNWEMMVLCSRSCRYLARSHYCTISSLISWVAGTEVGFFLKSVSLQNTF